MGISIVHIQSTLCYLLWFPLWDAGTKKPIKSCVCFSQLSMDPLSVVILALIQLDEKILATRGPLFSSLGAVMSGHPCTTSTLAPKRRMSPCAYSSEQGRWLSFNTSCVCAEQFLNMLFPGLLNAPWRQRVVVVRADKCDLGMVDS